MNTTYSRMHGTMIKNVAMVFDYGVIRTIITLRITKTVSQSWQVAHDRLTGTTRQCLNVQ